MDALSIAQAYAVFLLYSQGEKAAYPDNTQSGYILMAAFLELFFSGAIETDKKQRIRLHTPPGSKKYLQAIGEEIADGPPRTLGGWLEYYLSGFSDKDIHTVVCGVLDSLQEEGWLHPKGKGLFRTKYTLEPAKPSRLWKISALLCCTAAGSDPRPRLWPCCCTSLACCGHCFPMRRKKRCRHGWRTFRITRCAGRLR